MRHFKTVLLVLLFAGVSSNLFAQDPSKEVQLCANLEAILELNCGANDAPIINFNVVTKDDWKDGVESTDFSEFEICATCDWKLMCEVIGAPNGQIPGTNNGGYLPLNCLGKKIMWQGTNQITNAFEVTTSLANGAVMALSPPNGGSNIGDFDSNRFRIWWSLGQQVGLMPDESLLEKQVKADEYKVKVKYTLLPAQ